MKTKLVLFARSVSSKSYNEPPVRFWQNLFVFTTNIHALNKLYVIYFCVNLYVFSMINIDFFLKFYQLLWHRDDIECLHANITLTGLCCTRWQVSSYWSREKRSLYNRVWLHRVHIYDISTYWSLELTHWGRVTHICASQVTVVGSDNGLSPDRRQAIIWTNAEILLIEPLRTTLSDMLIEVDTFSILENIIENVAWKMAAIWSWPQYVNSLPPMMQ